MGRAPPAEPAGRALALRVKPGQPRQSCPLWGFHPSLPLVGSRLRAWRRCALRLARAICPPTLFWQAIFSQKLGLYILRSWFVPRRTAKLAERGEIMHPLSTKAKSR